MSLAPVLSLEQRAFLARCRDGWAGHLEHTRDFLGEGLRAADPARPMLIIGAGSGLEIPWHLAPPLTTGWDADPWSRLRTLLRHRRWVPWVFEDATSAFASLMATCTRSANEYPSNRRRERGRAVLRLAGLLPSLRPEAAPLRRWIAEHRPGTILAANLMGQFGCLAQRLVEKAFAPLNPWEEDPDLPDLLIEALEAWTARVVREFLSALAASGADLWLVHDRGVIWGNPEIRLGPLADPWITQVEGPPGLEISDSLAGIDVRGELAMFHVEKWDRWLWHLAPGQVHMVEAIAVWR